MSAGRVFYMSIPASLGPIFADSFEELRMADYLKAYQDNGKPPVPCRQEPANPSERIAMGLPPLFEPYVEDAASSLTLTPPVSQSVPSPSTSILRDAHEFSATPGEADTMLQNIVCQAVFGHFSTEELRYHAYLNGNRYAPTTTNPLNSSTQPQGAINNLAPEVFQTQTFDARFMHHSLEELRLAQLQTGRELTSAEIFALPIIQPPLMPAVPASVPLDVVYPTPRASPLFSYAGGGAFAHSPASRPF